MECEDIFEEMEERWPSSIVARKKIGVFTGGLIAPGTLANLDSMGQGPDIKIRHGRDISYPVVSFVRWFRSRCKVEKRVAS